MITSIKKINHLFLKLLKETIKLTWSYYKYGLGFISVLGCFVLYFSLIILLIRGGNFGWNTFNNAMLLNLVSLKSTLTGLIYIFIIMFEFCLAIKSFENLLYFLGKEITNER